MNGLDGSLASCREQDEPLMVSHTAHLICLLNERLSMHTTSRLHTEVSSIQMSTLHHMPVHVTVFL